MTADYNIRHEDLPDTLPVFPLSGVLLLPHGMLPLNVFEPRYLAMVDDALRTDRLIGIIQPREIIDTRSGRGAMQRVGCAGRIVQFSETPDGRYLITLAGMWRFNVTEECPPDRAYRRIKPNWTPYAHDLDTPGELDLDREKLCNLAHTYFKLHDLQVDCKQLEGASDAKIISALSMICPFDALDKQALLEAATPQERARLFMSMLEIAAHKPSCQSCH